jgi:hypothetical protein
MDDRPDGSLWQPGECSTSGVRAEGALPRQEPSAVMFAYCLHVSRFSGLHSVVKLAACILFAAVVGMGRWQLRRLQLNCVALVDTAQRAA